MKPMIVILQRAAARFAALAVALLVGLPAVAATDISSVPPSTMTSSSVRPNLMFILDDSGSMDYDAVPDSVWSYDRSKACFGYAGHNGVFYDPNITYTLPKDGNGGTKPAAIFTWAKDDGYNSGSSSRDLSDPSNLHSYSYSFPDTCTKGTSGCSNSSSSDAFSSTTVSVSCKKSSTTCNRTTTVSQQRYYYTLLKSGATDDCQGTSYTPVTSLSATEKQNYANWWQYYHTRMLMMRTAAGQVFDAIDPTRFRVGFTTISTSSVSDGSKFLNIRDFKTDTGDTTQKTSFFTKLYGQAPTGSTPLRPSLQKVGQYFAKKASNQTIDPMQYSCQRNYALLSTDGYWNTASEPSNFIPVMLDKTTAIGDRDGGQTPRPMLDVNGARNSLADMTKYYYDTDIRSSALNNCSGSVSGQNVCTNRDPKPGDTSPVYQNLTTFTLGLGVPGVLNYQSDYDTATSGDFYDLAHGLNKVDWPDPESSTNSGYADSGNTVTSRIDDLWHAAVNAGGHYYSARNPTELVAGLTDALERINVQSGSNAAAATSTLRPVMGDDWVFLPSYETSTWVGDVAAYRFNIDSSGAVSVPSTPQWNAYKVLAGQSSRKIVYFNSNASTKLADFTYSNLSSAQRAYFDNLCATGAYKLTQCATLTTNGLAQVTGSNVIDYLRGNKQYEMWQSNPDAKVFRGRQNAKGEWTPLGDVIDSTPGYVRVPPFKYIDAGYNEFKNAQANRTGVVYVGANDGMLHAFRATDGVELWAYVPTAVIPNLYRLADSEYSTTHRYFVDGTPVIADVYDGSAWHTILVAGLNAGGNSVYALDVTDPNNPKGLWEFTDANLGLTFGHPVIGKNKAGAWVVAFTSGYNNTTGGGDGNGHLYVLNALTGAQISTLATYTAGNTRAGSTTTPSNLGPLNGWVEKEEDNTIERLYAGDMLGNVWRFDFDDRIAPSGAEAMLLGKATGPDGSAQPITVQPVLSEVQLDPASYDVITVGTGRYLGQSDLGDKSVQSLYSFKDTLGSTSLGAFRSNSGMVKQTMDSSHNVANPSTVDWATKNGWYIDFDQLSSDSPHVATGERVNVEMDFQLGLISVATTLPTSTPCSPGGTSWLYAFSVSSGAVTIAQKSDVLIVGFGDILENAGPGDTGSPNLVVLSEGSDGSLKRTVLGQPGGGSSSGTTARRTSWRELTN